MFQEILLPSCGHKCTGSRENKLFSKSILQLSFGFGYLSVEILPRFNKNEKENVWPAILPSFPKALRKQHFKSIPFHCFVDW